MSPSPAEELLSSLPLFAGLAADELEEVAWLARPVSFSAGEEIFHQGDASREMYVIAKGRVRVRIRLAAEAQIEATVLGPGELLGEMALLDGGVRSATAVALEPTRGYSISAAAFGALCADFRPGAFKLLVALARLGLERFATSAARHHGPNLLLSTLRPAPDVAAPGTNRPRPAPVAVGIDAAASLPVFRAFSRHELSDLFRRAGRIDLEQREVLFRAGDAASSCFIVLRGALEMLLPRGGCFQRLAILGPGELAGYSALLRDGARSEVCRARGRASLLEIDRAVFGELSAHLPVVAFKFLIALNGSIASALRSSNSTLVRRRAESQATGRS